VLVRSVGIIQEYGIVFAECDVVNSLDVCDIPVVCKSLGSFPVKELSIRTRVYSDHLDGLQKEWSPYKMAFSIVEEKVVIRPKVELH